MAHLRLLAILVVATFCSIMILEAAVVRSDDFAEHLQRLASDEGSENLRTQRAIENRSERSLKHRCNGVPCGWEVYNRNSRRVEYFMKNTCFCPAAWKCVRSHEDLSVGAYVYICRDKVTPDDKESPHDAN